MESTGIVWKLIEAGGIHRPELDGSKRKPTEHTRNYCIVQGLGSVNPYSYPCRHVRASDLWCRRQRDVTGLLQYPCLLWQQCQLSHLQILVHCHLHSYRWTPMFPVSSIPIGMTSLKGMESSACDVIPCGPGRAKGLCPTMCSNL